jgi:hypothetical protein
MTTGTAADQAPRIAYELAACVADGDDEAVARLWAGLDGPARTGVVAALGAQARYAARGPGRLAGQVTRLLDDLRHCDARPAAEHSLTGPADAALPACDGCPRPAVALARARLRMMAEDGVAPPRAAEASRRAARR